MAGRLLLSTAYLPPAEYFAHIKDAEDVLIECHENYIKQSFRNRCYIVAANGIQNLTVPVRFGSFHKTVLRDIRIDYSKRWQQVHLGALNAAYRSSPFWQYYSDEFGEIILRKHEFLLDLNMELTLLVLKFLTLNIKVGFTESFDHTFTGGKDLRYDLAPKKPSGYKTPKYTRVFDHENDNHFGISIADLIFNLGPQAIRFL